MSSERIDPVEAAAAVEYPDRVGFKPDNPYLENFRPYIPANVSLRELTVLPAIMILGLDLEVTRVMLVALLGGLLGILMMIPLRRALIVAQHGYLKCPEGTACAEVLEAGASEESRAAASHAAKDGVVAEVRALPIFTGLGLGFLYQTAMGAFKAWKDTPEKIFAAPFKGGSIAAEISPALLGVGYIIGPRIASIM